MTSPSPKELRDASGSTRTRITADLDEVEARLRERVGRIVSPNVTHDSPVQIGILEGLRLVHGLTRSRAAAMLAGAALGYAAVRQLRR
jgi:hypothetical protein